MTQTVLKSLSITIAISLIAGAVGKFIFDQPLIGWFLVTLLLQFFCWNGLQYVMQVRSQIRIKEMEKDIITEVAKQSILIPCAYCKQENYVSVRFDINNEFECEGCNKNNVIYMNIESAQVTTPIELEETIKINEELRRRTDRESSN